MRKKTKTSRTKKRSVFSELKLWMIFITVVIGAAITLPAQATPSARSFVQTASIANEFEIESSKMALKKSENPEVRKFAQQMIDDHQKLGNEMKSAVAASNVDSSSLVSGMDRKHRKMMKKLEKASAADFDKKYISMQKDAHEDAVKLFKKYFEEGDDSTLKNFASDHLPGLQDHLDHVKGINL